MHYKNGREAKVGDNVVGITYNTKGKILSGTVMSITPGVDACSVLLGYLSTIPMSVGDMQCSGVTVNTSVSIHGSIHHGRLGQGDAMVTIMKTDYTECKNLLHVEDLFK
jgi:hypothetical protein